MHNDPELMNLALAEARAALEHGDVPIGALVVRTETGEVLASRHNEREFAHDPTAHAEILALHDAAQKVGDWRLNGCTLVVTLEPCPMCAGAAVLARVDRIVFGPTDPKAGACGTLYNVANDPRLNHRIELEPGVLAEECGAILKEFFGSDR